MKVDSINRLTIEEFLELQLKYGTDAEIGKLYGISRQAVYHYRTTKGIPYNKDKNAAKYTVVINAYKEGLTIRRIRELTKLSTSQIYRIVNKAGVIRKSKKK